MVDQNELKQAREKLRKLPLLYQAETYTIIVNSRGVNNENLNNPNQSLDYELTILKEALSIYNTNEYSGGRDTGYTLTSFLKVNSPWYYYIQTFGLLTTLRNIKNNKTTGDANSDKSYWVGERGVNPPALFFPFNEEISRWSNIFWTKDPDIVKSWYDRLMDSYVKNLKQSYPDGMGGDTVDAIKKELDRLTQWDTTFWTKDPAVIKTWYNSTQNYWTDNFAKDYSDGKGIDAPSLERVKADLKKIQNSDKFGDLKMFLLLHGNKNIQQLKEELKDKVLLTTSRKELLEKWSKYRYSILVFQVSNGDFALLWVNSEKKKIMMHYYLGDAERKGKAEIEINNFLQPTNLKVHYTGYWYSSNPNKNLNYTGFLAIAASEKMMSLVKSETKLNLGDDGKDQGEANYSYSWDW